MSRVAWIASLLVAGATAVIAGGGQGADTTFTPADNGPAIGRTVRPVYPAIAQAARVEGIVVLDFTVDVSGRVVDVRVIRSIALLDNSVTDAVRQWQFTPPETPIRMRATATFRLNDPSLYPRPARFLQPRPSWVPDNFAFMYQYECRRTDVEIDSIDHVVRNIWGTGNGARTREFGFSFEGDIVADAFTALDRADVFETSGDSVRAWKEVPRATSDFHQRGNELFVTIAADVHVINVSTPAQVQFFGGPGPSRRFSHVLAVRQRDRWKQVRWSEPVDKHDDLVRGFSAAGKRIRALVRDGLVPAAAAPVCL